jgi:hypothetical protein
MEIDVGLPLAHPEECLDTSHFLGALLEGVGQVVCPDQHGGRQNSWYLPIPHKVRKGMRLRVLRARGCVNVNTTLLVLYSAANSEASL